MVSKDHSDSSQEEPSDPFEAAVMHCFENAFSIPIPKTFQRSFGGPFRSCLVCGNSLIPGGHGEPVTIESLYPLYLVTKEIHRGEPWVEYALRWGCLNTLQDSYTPEFNNHVNELFMARVDPKERFAALTMAGAPVEVWIEKCVLSGEPVQSDKRHQLVAACLGDSLLLSFLPYAIAGQGLKMLEACFDDSTRKIRNEFVRKYLGVESCIFGGE